MHIINMAFSDSVINAFSIKSTWQKSTWQKLTSPKLTSSNYYAEVNFICPKYKRETEGGRTFSVTTIKLWNSLPLNLRRHLNVRIFKNKYVEILHAHQQSLSHF